MDHYRPSRSPDRRPPKRKVADLDPNDIGQDLRNSRAPPRRSRGFYLSVEARFEYYDTEWNLRLGERLLKHGEFRDLAEELDTTNIQRIHAEGMRRHREDEVRRQYRMIKPTVTPTSPPITRGPRADSSSSSPWPSQTPTPRRELTASSVAAAPRDREYSAAATLEDRITKPSSSYSHNVTTAGVAVQEREYSPAPPALESRITKPIPRRESTISSAAPSPPPPEPQEPGYSSTPALETRTTMPLSSDSPAAPPPKIIIRPIERRISPLSPASGAAKPQPAAAPPEKAPDCRPITSSQSAQRAPDPIPTACLSAGPEIVYCVGLAVEEKLSGDSTAIVKLPPRLGPGARKTSPRMEVEPEKEVQTEPQLQAQLQVPPPPAIPFPETPPPPPPPSPSPAISLPVLETQTELQLQPITPLSPPIKLEHPPSPPSPSILTEVTTRIHHRRATLLAEQRAAHAKKVKEAKRKCWEGAKGLVGEVGCLAEIVSAGRSGVDGEGEGEGEGGLFVPDENEDDTNTNLKQKGADAAGNQQAPPDLSEPLLLSTLVSLIAWEDNARSVRRRQEEVVGALEGMGMDAEEARKVVGRLGGVMARVAGVRWGLEDCLVLMGGEGG